MWQEQSIVDHTSSQFLVASIVQNLSILSFCSILVSDMNKGSKRFLKYTLVGGSTFALDLFFLFLLTDVFGWNYLIATALSFILSVSLNYLISRRYVFQGTLRSTHAGYVLFLGIAASGLLFVLLLMAICVEYFHIDYLLSRSIVALVVGMWNYLMNLYVNFKVAGLHTSDRT
jgi:putative flippase GtrA